MYEVDGGVGGVADMQPCVLAGAAGSERVGRLTPGGLAGWERIPDWTKAAGRAG